MIKQKRMILAMSCLALLNFGLYSTAYAGDTADSNSNKCRTCHTGNYLPDFHHATYAGMGNGEYLECMTCHQMKWNGEAQAYRIDNDGNFCFLKCHTYGLYRDSARMFDRVTYEVADANGWDFGVSGYKKIQDSHHQNFGALEYTGGNCAACHESFWNPDPGFWDSRLLEGAAQENSIYGPDGLDWPATLDANDGENITIIIKDDQLVFDLYKTGGIYSLHIDASDTEAAISAVIWRITGQAITSAADNLIFDYDFQWMQPGDTAVVKLEVYDTEGRNATQNIGVNFR